MPIWVYPAFSQIPVNSWKNAFIHNQLKKLQGKAMIPDQLKLMRTAAAMARGDKVKAKTNKAARK